MLTIETATAYAATIAAGYTFHNARFANEDGVQFVFIDLQHGGEPAGRMDVWAEHGPNGPYLYGEYCGACAMPGARVSGMPDAPCI